MSSTPPESDAARDTRVRCRSCHRTERWRTSDGDEGREVLIVGGRRRPAVHPELAAWEVLLEAHHGQSGPIVAACPACGQPMISDDPEAPAVEWTVQTPEGALKVKVHGLRGPEGSLAWAEADAMVRRHYETGLQWREYVGPTALFRGGLLTMMLAPVALWVGAAGTVVLFLMNFYR